MRITQQVLRSKANGPLQSTEFLDLSNLGIVSIEKLQCCPKLQALSLRGNCIAEVANLDQNRNLWRLDLSNNEIKDLDCLTRFVALGTLNLANNDLSWQEIGKLRHMHILELSLHGNKKLEKDPYYRIHIIDCLPNVWMLDGRIVTSAERLQVKHFFADSALTDHPIRRKLSKEWFVPSTLKKIEVNGVYGEKATHLMTRFPSNGPSNIDVDRRRLKYLAYNAQEDLTLEKKYTKRDFQVLKYRHSFIEDLLEVRPADRERCNMLLLMLVATLEFVMPTHLVKETLETAKLSRVGKVYSMDLFLLPKDIRCRLVCILLGAVKMDKDSKEDGGLYDKLYLCLFYTVAELSKLSNSVMGPNKTPKTKMNRLYRDYKCLLASEVVQLLCIVPAFFEYVDKDVGVMNLLVTATGDAMVTEKINKLTENIHMAGGDIKKLYALLAHLSSMLKGDIKKLYEELSDFLLQKVQEQSLNLANRTQKLPQQDQVITTTKAIPMKSPRSPLDAADFHARGISSPYTGPPSVMSEKAVAEKSKKHFPHLGDYLLLGPQTLGKIIGLPQPFLAHVAMDSIPVANGAMESKLRQSEDHYTYVNMDQFSWDQELSFWKPKGSIGDSMLQEFLMYSNVLSSYRRRVLPFIQPVTQGLLFTNTVPLVEPKHFIFHCRWFTIHTIEDLRKELNRRANVSTDHVPRPNSPEDSRIPYSITPGRDVATPLIFSSGGLHSMSEDYISRRQQYTPNEFSPRPMTSLLKEKLDLKLDLSSRPRAQSASAVERSSRASYNPSNTQSQPDSKATVTEAKDNVESAPVEGDNSVAPETSHSVECVQCAMSSGSVGDESNKPNGQEQDNDSSTKGQEPSHSQGEPATADDTPHKSEQKAKDSNKENEAPPATGRTDIDSLAHSDDEPELQALGTGRSTERPTSAHPSSRQPEPKPSNGDIPRTKSSSSLQINIPQVDLIDTESIDGSTKVKGKVPVPKGRQSASSFTSRSSFRPGKFVAQGNNRPFSAMDAYRYIVSHPRKPIGTENVYNTSYQQQRTEAWRQSASAAASNPHTPRQGTPPPQRPTSPDNKNRPSSSLSVKKANDWLAGGRDLYWESLQKRPRSGHVPGWKEGLPDSMKRPRTAVAQRTLNRQSTRRTPPVTPSSLAYEAMMQGGRSYSARGYYDNRSPYDSRGSYDNRSSHDNNQIPDMLDLNEYQPLYHHIGVPRRLGSPVSSASQDFSAQPPQDMVYRMPPSSPTRMKTPISTSNYKNPPFCMQCIYEDQGTGDHGSHFHGNSDTLNQIIASVNA